MKTILKTLFIALLFSMYGVAQTETTQPSLWNQKGMAFYGKNYTSAANLDYSLYPDTIGFINYNPFTKKFMVRENGVWVELLSGTGGGSDTNIGNTNFTLASNTIRNLSLSTTSIFSIYSDTNQFAFGRGTFGYTGSFMLSDFENIFFTNDAFQLKAEGTDPLELHAKRGFQLKIYDASGNELQPNIGDVVTATSVDGDAIWSTPSGGSGSAVTIDTDDTFASAVDTTVPSTLAVKNHVQNQIASVSGGSAPVGDVESGETSAVSGGTVYDYYEDVARWVTNEYTPIIAVDGSSYKFSTDIPNWRYDVRSGAVSYQPIPVKEGFSYEFEDWTYTVSGNYQNFFLDADGQVLGNFQSITFTAPKDCTHVIVSALSSGIGSNFKLVQTTNELEDFDNTPNYDIRSINLVDTDNYMYEVSWDYSDDLTDIGLKVSIPQSSTSYSIDVTEGESYYTYYESSVGGENKKELMLLDENFDCIGLLEPSIYQSSAITNMAVHKYEIPTGVSYVRMNLAQSTNQNDALIAGNCDFAFVHESNIKILTNYKASKEHIDITDINDAIRLSQPIEKAMFGKNFLLFGDSVYASQYQAEEAYYAGDRNISAQGTNTVGGVNTELLRRLRPYSWQNYAMGGYTLTYDGTEYGSAIYAAGASMSYIYQMEKFFVDYDAYIADPVSNPVRYAPDVVFIASCINDFTNPTESYITDAELTTAGLTYDEYMETEYMTTGSSNDTLIPLEDIASDGKLLKVAGGLRYMIERLYRKFPKVHIVVITSNKTANHPRVAQMSTTRDMIWMANRLNATVIDVFNGGSQLNMLKEYKDETTGTRDELYLTTDGIHNYLGDGKGYQRMGRFIVNELVQKYFSLEDFIPND